MAATDSWEVAAFSPESQAVFTQDMAQPVRPKLGSGSLGTNRGVGMLPEEIQPKPYERMLQCWELEFQEFLEAEDFPWEDSRLQDWLAPWENPEAFLTSFQQVALACRWPRKEWVTRLLPALNEDATKAFCGLEDKDQGDFRKVKAAILQREAMNQERKRQQFRRFCYQEANGPREVCLQLQQLCHQWLKAERQTKEQILEQVILEQFLNILPKEMQTWVRERGPVTCNRAVTLAEDFLRKLLAAEREEGQHLQEQDDAAMNYSKTKASPPARDLLWAKKEISMDPRSSKRSYTRYDQARGGKRKSLEGGRLEQAEHWPKSQGRASRASPYQMKQEGIVKERRRSERLKGTYPARRPDPSSPREEARKTFLKTSVPPEHPQGRTRMCPECGQSFSGLSSFMRHQARHTGEKRHECCFCGRGFCWRSDLTRHECMHTGKKPHECQFCGEGFDRKWQRQRHELGHVKVGRRLC